MSHRLKAFLYPTLHSLLVPFSLAETIPGNSTGILYHTFISTWMESLRCTHSTDKLLCPFYCMLDNIWWVQQILKHLVHTYHDCNLCVWLVYLENAEKWSYHGGDNGLNFLVLLLLPHEGWQTQLCDTHIWFGTVLERILQCQPMQEQF